jgi:hypothetical protein
MSKKVGGDAPRGAHPCLGKRFSRNVGHRSMVGQTDARRYASQKNAPRVTLPTAFKVESKRLSNIRQQRHAIPHAPFSAHNDLAGAPTDVTKLERHYFSSTQAQSCQQQEDRVVAKSAQG